MNSYRVTAMVPWGIEHYVIAAPNHLAACAYVRECGQPRGAVQPIPIAWEKVSGESAAASSIENAAASLREREKERADD